MPDPNEYPDYGTGNNHPPYPVQNSGSHYNNHPGNSFPLPDSFSNGNPNYGGYTELGQGYSNIPVQPPITPHIPGQGEGDSQSDKEGFPPAPPGDHVGPFLRFYEVDLNSQVWYGSVLYITLNDNGLRTPTLNLRDGPNNFQIPGERLYTYGSHIFWRFDIRVRMGQQEKMVNYSIENKVSYKFAVPAFHQQWRMSFWSCNGFSADIKDPQAQFGGKDPLWRDLMAQHNSKPYHAMIGGGDQLYCDAVFPSISEIVGWLSISNRSARDKAPWTSSMASEVERFYFNNYCLNFDTGVFKEAQACIPTIYIVDDHDIFDGYGSYPDSLQNSPVIQGIGKTAIDYFLLFQQHTTRELAFKHGYFGNRSYQMFKHLGPTTCLLALDTRSERLKHQIISRETWDMIFDVLNTQIPSSCQHLIVGFGVPIVYPRLSIAESTLQGISASSLFQKTGAFPQVMNAFGEPELLDDLTDHWTAEPHMLERQIFVQRLQQVAQSKNVRVTFLAGDVHAGGAGYFATRGQTIDPGRDHRYMVQIISSAIVNGPPPDMVVRVLHVSSSTYKFDENTEEQMIELFSQDVNGKSRMLKKILNRRNWCSIDPTDANGWQFTLNIEKEDHSGTIGYVVNVPNLMKIQ
ncbi:hypothetical protein K493DRAFT_213159 [Basidiobolus meristosporus CBS 931.73]|uniref:PhoD-like phosphatase domain-containing protein n=1 Tax=Basidiobolus meristosporus CBS 931.73 TaxID=1314790 RepID=A0A1Y1YM75_9FUNG|nr:hypothetical protein K493DRAFT_213159 [Basidiobolus meristosporus CBS 931.73]|eukprot:ORX99117.1 hypothetical protein K493DRAFT_213159 [Basidiobolus meristosporus CBS 931.73]